MKKREKTLIEDYLRPSAHLSVCLLSSHKLVSATKCGSHFYEILCRGSFLKRCRGRMNFLKIGALSAIMYLEAQMNSSRNLYRLLLY
jgi:hypothetical protein